MTILSSHSGRFHKLTFAIFSAVTVGLLICSQSIIVAIAAALLLNFYLLSALFEMSVRTRKKIETPVFLALPNREYCLAICLISLCLFVFVFASLYISLGGVECSKNPVNNWTDSIYFSAVTITTLGYGECLPISVSAKLTVVGQLFSGLIGFAAALSAVVSRSVA